MIEELSYIDNSFEEGIAPELLPHEGNLGKHSYFIKSTRSETVKNFFVAEMEKVTRYAVPFIKNIKIFLPTLF